LFDYSSLVGVPYMKNGRDISKGVDCLGLCIEYYKRKGINNFPDFSAPNEREAIHELMMQGKDLFEELDKPEEGCIIALSIRPPFVSHIGIMIDNNRFVHTLTGKRSVIAKINDIFWSKRIRGFYRYGTTANHKV